jgi:uncharacterized protein YycO
MLTAIQKIWYLIKSKVLKFASDIRIYPLGVVLYGQTGYKVKGDNIRKLINVLRRGDVILTSYDHYLGYLFMHWGHAGVYVGQDKRGRLQRVIHMMGSGIQNEDILTFSRKDHMMILRCPDLIRAEKAAEVALKLWDEKVDYDYDFKLGNKTMYCSELVWHVYDEDPSIEHKRWVTPENLICPLFEFVLEVP